MLKLLMIFTVLSPEGVAMTSLEKDVTLTMTYEECVTSAPTVGEIVKEHYRTIQYQLVEVKTECEEVK